MEKTTSEIGELLYIAPDTIKTHRKNIMSKLGAINMAGMVRRAFEAGYLVLG
jgi:DNA-binding CsgD family transcriptional regulator